MTDVACNVNVHLVNNIISACWVESKNYILVFKLRLGVCGGVVCVINLGIEDNL